MNSADDEIVIAGDCCVKSKGAVSKQISEINQLTDDVLRKNNFNSTKLEEEDGPVICQPSNALQFPVAVAAAAAAETQLPGNEVNMRKDSQVSSGSKIPVFNPSLRISKCSSWACGDISPSPEITDLTPGKFLIFYFVFFHFLLFD